MPQFGQAAGDSSLSAINSSSFEAKSVPDGELPLSAVDSRYSRAHVSQRCTTPAFPLRISVIWSVAGLAHRRHFFMEISECRQISKRKHGNERNESRLKSSQPFPDDARASRGFSMASGCWYQRMALQTGKLLTSVLQLPPIAILAEQLSQSSNSNCETEPQCCRIPDSDRIEPPI